MLHGKRVLRFFTAVIVAVAPLALADDASAIRIPGTYSYTQTVTVTYEGQSESANDQGMCLVKRRRLDWGGTIVVLGVEVTAKIRFNKRLKERLAQQTIKGQGQRADLGQTPDRLRQGLLPRWPCQGKAHRHQAVINEPAPH
jgi:hypothetical protein